jgi:hypothetical protein
MCDGGLKVRAQDNANEDKQTNTLKPTPIIIEVSLDKKPS